MATTKTKAKKSTTKKELTAFAEMRKGKSFRVVKDRKFILHSKFNHIWLEDGWVAHPLDEQSLSLLKKGRAHEDAFLEAIMLDENFDGINCCLHCYYGHEDKVFRHQISTKLMLALKAIENISDKELKKDKKNHYLLKLRNHPGYDRYTGIITSDYHGQAISSLWSSLTKRSLKVLSYANPESIPSGESVSLFETELEWIASEQFDAVARSVGLNSNIIRTSLPNIMKAYGKPLGGHCARLLQAFKQISQFESVNLTFSEATAGSLSTLPVKVGNEKTHADNIKTAERAGEKKTAYKKTLAKANGRVNNRVTKKMKDDLQRKLFTL